MAASEILTRVLFKKAAYYAFGWAATKWYNSSFSLYWERPVSDLGHMHSDWKKILCEYKNQPHDIYISAGDLWSMGPFLINLQKDRSCNKTIKRIYVRHLSKEIVEHLSVGTAPFLPLISPTLLQKLDHNIQELRSHYGQERVIAKPFQKFPKFHGVIYGSHLSYCPWWLDSNGQLSHRTAVYFMHREHDHELFDELKFSLLDGINP